MADNRFRNKDLVLRRMKRIPSAVRAAAREELDRQAAFLVEQIRPIVPREHGDLAASLEWRRSRNLYGSRGDRLVVVVTEGANDDTLGRKARAVEFGRGGDNPMEPQPHFFPTYRAFKRRIKAALNKAVRNAARKAVDQG